MLVHVSQFWAEDILEYYNMMIILKLRSRNPKVLESLKILIINNQYQ